MATRRKPRRARGGIEGLPSGGLRVTVCAGIDPVSKRRHYLREVVPAGPRADAKAEKVRSRLLNQVDERRQPKTRAAVDQLLDRHFEHAELERTTLSTYVGYAKKHIRPLLGHVQVAALDADVFDSFYAELRRCRLAAARVAGYAGPADSLPTPPARSRPARLGYPATPPPTGRARSPERARAARRLRTTIQPGERRSAR